MLSSVSVGEGLKTRPTPSPSVDAPKTPNCVNKDARDASAAVKALEASLEACLKSAAALVGLSTVSLVDATCVTQSDFFFIHRDRFLNAFSNLPEVLAEMAAREDVYRRRPVRVPKASLGSI